MHLSHLLGFFSVTGVAFGALDGLEERASSLCKVTPTAEFLNVTKILLAQPKIGGENKLQPINVDTYVHVVAQGKRPNQGWVTDSAIKEQMKVLNSAFKAHSIQFKLIKTDRTVNIGWATSLIGSPGELDMKYKLRKGTYKTLNLYVLGSSVNNPGVGTLPEDPKPKPKTPLFVMDGVTVGFDLLPRGSTGSQGKRAVHMVGHWLGLLHTYEGFSCSGFGDGIDDTPQQSIAGTACGFQDSCPGEEGLDAIDNYMDSTEESCLDNFTEGQRDFMHSTWTELRK